MYKEFNLEKAKNGAKIALEVWRDLGFGKTEFSYRKARIIGYIRNTSSVVFAFETEEEDREFVGAATPEGVFWSDACKYRLLIQEEERIPFTIEDYKDGDVVEYKGKRATIFTTKANSYKPIIGQVDGDDDIYIWSEEVANKSLVIIR